MNIDLPLIGVSLFFSAIGFLYFRAGKSQTKFNLLFCGMALMGYSYFLDDVVKSIVIGLGLTALPFLLKWW